MAVGSRIIVLFLVIFWRHFVADVAELGGFRRVVR